jgi:hypothetical protein
MIYILLSPAAKGSGASSVSISIIKPVMSHTPIPILLTGRTAAIGQTVIDLMSPEYEGKVFFHDVS